MSPGPIVNLLQRAAEVSKQSRSLLAVAESGLETRHELRRTSLRLLRGIAEEAKTLSSIVARH